MNADHLMQLIRDAYNLAGNLADELVRLEAEDDKEGGFWNGDDFFQLISTFLSSMKQFRGIEIENESFGSKLIGAMDRQDKAEMSRYRFEMMSSLKALSGGKRTGYLFFLFWPQLHMALTGSN